MYRHRDYRIYAIDISFENLIEWKWYSNHQSKYFLNYLKTSPEGSFYPYMNDYVKVISLYIYGGTFIDMDIIILQPLPTHEFIGLDPLDNAEDCLWCLENTPGFYLPTSLIRVRSHAKFLRTIIKSSFHQQVYNKSCVDCTRTKVFTEHILQLNGTNERDLNNLTIFEPYRLYPFMLKETVSIFDSFKKDTSLVSAAVLKRSYSLRYFDHESNQFSIKHHSLVDYLINHLNLGIVQRTVWSQKVQSTSASLIHRPLYIYTNRKNGRFQGRDVIYLSLDQTLVDESLKWNINIRVSNGTISYSNKTLLFNCNQAQINKILHEIKYEPYDLTSIDRLTVHLTNGEIFINSSLTILIFSKWVTFLVTPIKASQHQSAIDKLIANIEDYFPQTLIHIISDLNYHSVNNDDYSNLNSSNNIQIYRLNTHVFIHNIPADDQQVISSYDYFLNSTSTPFFFLMNENFTIEDYSHIDLLLELIYTYKHIDIIAENMIEDKKRMNDFSSLFVRYNQIKGLTDDNLENERLHILSFNGKNDWYETNPCDPVDFMPRSFMGRKESVHSIGWDEIFKQNDNELFFSQLYHSNRTAYICRYI